MHIKSSGQRTTSSMAIDRTCPCVSPVSRWGSDDEARAGDETYLAMYLADDSLGEELHMYMYHLSLLSFITPFDRSRRFQGDNPPWWCSFEWSWEMN